jgi:hypothetical protein
VPNWDVDLLWHLLRSVISFVNVVVVDLIEVYEI